MFEVTQFAEAELAPMALAGQPEFEQLPLLVPVVSAQQLPWHCDRCEKQRVLDLTEALSRHRPSELYPEKQLVQLTATRLSTAQVYVMTGHHNKIQSTRSLLTSVQPVAQLQLSLPGGDDLGLEYEVDV